jgi:hypothetical protein
MYLVEKSMYKKIFPVVAGLLLCFTAAHAVKGAPDFESYGWMLINEEARWAPRAGLQVISLRNRFYLMGGRTNTAPPGFSSHNR